jgi:hypothetical protein
LNQLLCQRSIEASRSSLHQLLVCSRLEHFATSDGACSIDGFQQRAAPAVVEHQGAEVVGHPPLHVVHRGAAHTSVVLHALRGHALVVRAQLVPPDVVARRREIPPVHQVPVVVADMGVQVDAGTVQPPIPVSADGCQKPLPAHVNAAAAHCKATTLHAQFQRQIIVPISDWNVNLASIQDIQQLWPSAIISDTKV